jgi:hypothetical protein
VRTRMREVDSRQPQPRTAPEAPKPQVSPVMRNQHHQGRGPRHAREARRFAASGLACEALQVFGTVGLDGRSHEVARLLDGQAKLVQPDTNPVDALSSVERGTNEAGVLRDIVTIRLKYVFSRLLHGVPEPCVGLFVCGQRRSCGDSRRRREGRGRRAIG